MNRFGITGLLLSLVTILLTTSCTNASDTTTYTGRRHRMVSFQIEARGINDQRLLDAMRKVPRHRFVPDLYRSQAYSDYPLPIGAGQTISQPYIVARMTELVISEGECHSVLEIGTGCGYQTAILSHFFEKVNTVERISALLDGARRRFAELSLRNIRPRLSDGSEGWARSAPFDAIIATAAPEEIPEGLLSQLAIGGRLVIPVGRMGHQVLARVVRESATRYVREDVEKVSFVPMLAGTK